MIEEGKTYKLKKIKGINNTDQNCTILKIVDSPNKELGKIAFYQLDNGDRYVAPVSEFIDPEDPKEYSDLLFQKLESVMKPMNLTFWKQLKEEGAAGGMASLGAAPCPAIGQITGGNISGCMVNGIPVAGKSVKKKKKSKKNEDVQRLFNNGHEDKYKEKTEVVVTPEEMLDEIEDTFDPANILVTFVENSREKIKISVQYDTSYPAYLHILKLEFLDIDDSVLDEVIEEDLAIQDCIEELKYLFKTHKRPNIEFSDLSSDEIDEALSIFSPEMDEAGRQYHKALMDYADGKIESTQFASIKKKFMDMLAQCDPDLNENFLEEYEDITDLIAKQLDRLDFKFANTDDIIYKKEGEFKYLIKFDNEIGILKFKVSKGQDIVFEKEYQLENEEDVTNAFEEIENIYRENGI